MLTRLSSNQGLDVNAISQSCGPRDGHISIAGSFTVEPVSLMWSEVYKLGCPVTVELDGGGSSVGAGRVCANNGKGQPVEIGNMCREWKEGLEAERRGGFIYDCLTGDRKRLAFQIDVAKDGITVFIPRGGNAYDCITALGGLTVDQLRWMYSSYSDSELMQPGWNPSSLKNSDGNPSTHLWSELDSRCATSEIQITGDWIGDGSYTDFSEFILSDVEHGEHIALDRKYGYFQGMGYDLLIYLLKQDDALAYAGYSYYSGNSDLFYAVPVKQVTSIHQRKQSETETIP